MRRTRFDRSLLATLLVLGLVAPGGAWAQDDAPVSDSEEIEETEAYEYPDEDLGDPDYVDIDTYGTDGSAATGDGTAGLAGSTGSGLAGASDGTADATAAVDDGRSIADHARRAGEVTMDVAIFRPFGAVATGVGFAFLVGGSPFLVISNDFDTARDVFVGERARYTFERPIGQF